MWKRPNRPNNQISQTFNDGLVKICVIEDIATPGYAPKPTITEVKATLRYAEKRVGINRYYSAMQNQIEIAKVIRVLRLDNITTQDIAVLQNGEKFRIDQVQVVEDVYPQCLDLSLVRYQQTGGEFDVV